MSAKKILISNGRSPMTLDFIRNLHAEGHQIFIAETTKLHICRFSNATHKSFVVPSPRFSPKEHIEALHEIITEHKIDLFLPIWEDIFLVSKYLDRIPCKVFASPFELLHKLHNKHSFIKFLDHLDIATPKTRLIRSKEELNQIDLPKYALKACYSRASSKVYKITKGDPLPDVTPSHASPWIAQEWLEGTNFCSLSFCHHGKVHAHATYPTELVLQKKMKKSASVESSCLTFRHIDHPKITAWVEEFAKKTGFTGQVAFDFIELKDGSLYAIECNPRMTNGITLFSPKDKIDEALFGTNQKLVTPKHSLRKQIIIGMLIYGWKSAIMRKQFFFYLSSLFHCKDLVFHRKDLRPFFSLPLLWCKYLNDSRRYKTPIPSAFTHDLDYDGDPS